MTPHYLKLRNFIGIRAGLDRDEIELDFDALAPEAVLIAIAGPNGTGKTTIMDSLHPYRLMPSRAGGHTPGSFSFFDNVYGVDALKELVWSHAGTRYRSTFIFKMPGKTKKAEAYLHRWDDDAWAVYTAPDSTPSDGKANTYDLCVEAVLGVPELFFSSVFSAQGRRSLTGYGNADIKALMSELLGLETVRVMGKKSLEVTRLLRTRRAALDEPLRRIDTAEHELRQATTELDGAQVLLNQRLQGRFTARSHVQDAMRKLAEVKADQHINTDTEIRRKALTDRRQTLATQRASLRRDYDADRARETAHYNQARDQWTIKRQRLIAAGSQHNDRLKQQQAIVARAAEINEAEAGAAALEALRGTQEQAVTQAREAVTSHAEISTQCATLQERMAALAREGKDLARQHAELQQRSALTAEVPCVGTDLQPRCKLLADAVAAKDTLPQVARAAEDKRREYRQTRDRASAREQVLVALGTPHIELSQAETAVRETAAQIRVNDALRALKDTLAHAETAIADLTQQITEVRADIKAGDTQLEQDKQARDAHAAALAARHEQSVAAIDTETEQVAAELAQLPDPADTSAIEKAEQAAAQADADLARLEQAIEQSNAAVATRKAGIAQLQQVLRGAQRLKQQADKLDIEDAVWRTLGLALGNDGIIALAIDDAGPTLSGLANDLLLSCYGPRFTVRIETQKELGTGALKETFDVTVFDAEREDEKSVSAMSGGEKIYINEALTRAVALYHAQNSGQQYGCLFTDETDGALDAEKKQQFTRMKREVLRIGGFQREYFISHAPEVQALADATIDMAGYRV